MFTIGIFFTSIRPRVDASGRAISTVWTIRERIKLTLWTEAITAIDRLNAVILKGPGIERELKFRYKFKRSPSRQPPEVMEVWVQLPFVPNFGQPHQIEFWVTMSESDEGYRLYAPFTVQAPVPRREPQQETARRPSTDYHRITVQPDIGQAGEWIKLTLRGKRVGGWIDSLAEVTFLGRNNTQAKALSHRIRRLGNPMEVDVQLPNFGRAQEIQFRFTGGNRETWVLYAPFRVRVVQAPVPLPRPPNPFIPPQVWILAAVLFAAVLGGSLLRRKKRSQKKGREANVSPSVPSVRFESKIDPTGVQQINPGSGVTFDVELCLKAPGSGQQTITGEELWSSKKRQHHRDRIKKG